MDKFHTERGRDARSGRTVGTQLISFGKTRCAINKLSSNFHVTMVLWLGNTNTSAGGEIDQRAKGVCVCVCAIKQNRVKQSSEMPPQQ